MVLTHRLMKRYQAITGFNLEALMIQELEEVVVQVVYQGPLSGIPMPKHLIEYLKNRLELSINSFIIIILGSKLTQEMTFIAHGVQ